MQSRLNRTCLSSTSTGSCMRVRAKATTQLQLNNSANPIRKPDKDNVRLADQHKSLWRESHKHIEISESKPSLPAYITFISFPIFHLAATYLDESQSDKDREKKDENDRCNIVLHDQFN